MSLARSLSILRTSSAPHLSLTGMIPGGPAESTLHIRKPSARISLWSVQVGCSQSPASESTSTVKSWADAIRMVPISNYLLPALPLATSVSPDPAPFRRPEPSKRSSLPFVSSVPSSPISERPEEIRRSPSPETIARMSMTGSGSSTANRSASMDRAGSLSMEKSSSKSGPRRRGREASLPLEVETGRRSPKPEADGKLDR